MTITIKNILRPSVVLLAAACLACSPTVQQKRDANNHHEMGVYYLNAGDSIRALQELVKARELNPGDKHIMHDLGIAYKERRLHREAEESFLAAVKIDDTFSEGFNSLGVLYLENRKYKEAVKAFDRALRNIFYTTPEYAHTNRGSAYLNLGEQVAAEKDFREAIALNPSFDPAYVGLARLLLVQKRMQDAELVLQKLVAAYDRHGEGHYLLGTIYAARNDKARAIEHFEKSLRAEPAGPFARMSRESLDRLR